MAVTQSRSANRRTTRPLKFVGRPADAAEFWFAENDPEGAGILDKSATGSARPRPSAQPTTARQLTNYWQPLAGSTSRKLRYTPGRPTESGLQPERWANSNSPFSRPFEGGNIRGKNPCNINCQVVRWCARRDSNPHDFTHCHLKAARLPIPPRALGIPAGANSPPDQRRRCNKSEMGGQGSFAIE